MGTDRQRVSLAGEKYKKRIVGEARRLPLPKGTVDIVILHGPRLHLPDAEDRQLALFEAQRVLCAGVVVLAQQTETDPDLLALSPHIMVAAELS